MSRITIYDLDGGRMAELVCNARRSWKLNEYGEATFTLSGYDAKTALANLEFGRYVLIEHPTLPDWGGVIWPPREWGYHQVTIHARSAEWLLGKLRGPADFSVSGPGGTVFAELIAQSLAPGAAPLEIGEIHKSEKTYSKPSHFAKVYDECKKMAQDNQNDWEISPLGDAGRLLFLVNYYEKRGQTREFILKEGYNLAIGGRGMSEQGEIVNNMLGYDSTEGTWANRMRSIAVDEDSRQDYGYWAGSMTHTIGHIQSASNKVTRAELEKKKRPRKTFDLQAIQVATEYENLRVGDTVRLELKSIGFTDAGFGLSTRMRILGMSYDDADGKLGIVGDEVV